MRLWIDDVRPAPEGDWMWLQSVDFAKAFIQEVEWDEYDEDITIELIDIDHDAGDYAIDGGDYIKLLDWLEATNRNYPIRLHSQNPVGVENMRRIIKRNDWTEVK